MDTELYHRRREAAHQDAVNEARILGGGRMLREDQDITPEIAAAIVERFRALLGRLTKSEAWAARSLGMPGSTLSQVLSGNYEGDAESRLRSIDKWTENQIAREHAPRPSGFAKTSTALSIIGLAKMAQKVCGIGVCYGPSGIGKTLTARFLVSDMPGAIYFRVTTAGVGTWAIYRALAAELRVPCKGMTAYQIELAVCEVLNGSGRLLIVDEVHKLCKRHKDHGLHVLRDLHDKTEIPMLFLGTEDVKNYIDNGDNPAEAVEQILGRVAWWLDLTHAAAMFDGGPGIHSPDDIRKVLASSQMRVAVDAERYLTELANCPRLGGLRMCVRLVQMAILKHGAEKPLGRQVLLDLQEERLGKRAAQAIQTAIELERRRKTGGA